MKITRRNFLTAAPAVAGAILGLRNVGFGQKTLAPQVLVPKGTDQLSKLTWDSFYPLQNTEFLFHSGGVDIPLVLEAVVNSGNIGRTRPKSKGGECFILRFIGPGKLPLKQGTYDVNHFLLGDFQLFITEGGQMKGDNYYIAVINRIVA